MEKEQQYKVLISPHAFKMLDRQVRFVAEISAVSANKLRNQVISEIRTLRKMPERYPVIDDPNITAQPYRVLYVPNWILVFYHIVNDEVWIDYIVDARQDYGWLIK